MKVKSINGTLISIREKVKRIIPASKKKEQLQRDATGLSIKNQGGKMREAQRWKETSGERIVNLIKFLAMEI